MAVTLLITVQIICAVALIMCIVVIMCVVQLIRLSFLSREVHRIIDDVFEKRMAGLRSGKNYEDSIRGAQYPDIDATYDNLRWYTFWRRPSTLIVLEKEVN